jgi:hypothetical protein
MFSGKKVNQTPPPPMKSRRTIYVVLGVIAVAAVVLTWGFVFLPQYGSAAILLRYHYAVGEDMTYNVTTVTYLHNSENNTSTTMGTFNLFVTSFDGENYTINENSIFGRISQNDTFKVNASGRLTIINGSASLFESSNMLSNLETLSQKSEVSAGQTWQVPLESESPSIALEGNLTCTVGPIQSIQVPAGTYKVFRLDVSSNNITETIYTHLPSLSNETIWITATLNGTSYLEYGTCRLIISHMEESSTIISNQNTNETSSLDTQLVNDTEQ